MQGGTQARVMVLAGHILLVGCGLSIPDPREQCPVCLVKDLWRIYEVFVYITDVSTNGTRQLSRSLLVG